MTLFPSPSRLRHLCLALALLGQLLPVSHASVCMAGCCRHAGPGSCCNPSRGAVDAGATECPHCGSSRSDSPRSVPCQCAFLARQDLAVAATDRHVLDLDRPIHDAVGMIQSTMDDELTPIQIAASHAIRPPIARPVRILYGVWRN
jgi:hypothetical protein